MPLVMLLVFAFTLFCSATLLFLIEPMVGKMMLPLLGGTPAVWNTCMVFFQAILLAGYAFSHATTTWLGARRQGRLQLAVLFLPLISFILNAGFFTGLLSPNEQLILGREANPIPALLLVLTLSVGLPMFVVCTSAPLLTRWFSSTDHPASQDPYFLYGASNLGSMLMLVCYPLLVEPYLSLKGQQIVWVTGYGMLCVCIAVCAVLMWRARPAVEPRVLFDNPPAEPTPTSSAIKPADLAITRSPKGQIQHKPEGEPPITHDGPDQRPVDWKRRLRWIVLALIPSSLMLGVTTYITTDIAAIPLLWIPPLALYLLTFIIVFAHISPVQQSIFTLVSTIGLIAFLVLGVAPEYVHNDALLWLLRVSGLGLSVFSFQILKVRDTELIHRVMIMIMPLMVLLLLFMMLSEIKPGTVINISLHLATLFVVAMVCHGELALDRPEPKHLTEFFLLMSIGGVVGGLFNALFAPLLFNSLVEYPLVMMLTCLMLPPLGISRENVWARRADLALAAVFLLVGGTLLFLRLRYRPADFAVLHDSPWQQSAFALAAGIAIGSYAAWRGWGYSGTTESGEPEPNYPIDRVLDVALPLALLVLVLGLFWGLPTPGVYGRLAVFASWFHISNDQFRTILTYGLPAVLCYTFVERSARFGLGVGAILLAAGFSGILSDPPIFQARSFFGVLHVEEGPAKVWEMRDSSGNVVFVNSITEVEKLRSDGAVFVTSYEYDTTRLQHGTTLHGKQFQVDAIRDIPLSYYHRTGPIGNIFGLYNTDPKQAVAAIGLGTGTMASYGLPGQTFDFYDIDPVVVGISFDTDEYFHFVEDAQARGVDVSLVLGDARLTFQPRGEKTRLKPLHHRKALTTNSGTVVRDAVNPERTFGKPIEEDFKYRLIVVDAFSSDAIPMHLITKQALKIYLSRLLPGGVICMHISNRYLDLQPVLANIADELGIVGYQMSDDDNSPPGKNRSHWVALARTKDDLKQLLNRPRWQNDPDQLSLLGAACWPSSSAIMSATTGLCYAFSALAEKQSQMLAEATRLPRDTYPWPNNWVPLDQPSVLEEFETTAPSVIAELQAKLDQISGPVKAAQKHAEETQKPVTQAKKDLEIAKSELTRTEASFGVSSDKDRTRLNASQLAMIDRKKKALRQREIELKQANEAADKAEVPKLWLERVERRLQSRLNREESSLNGIPRRQLSVKEKLARARRYGVWTDDYSNIIAALNF